MMPAVLVPRIMREADLAEVAALESSVQAFPWSLGHFSDALKAGYDGWVVRDLHGRLLGFSLLMPAPDVMHLLVIAIAPDRQRQGVGSLLMRWAESRARACRAPGLLLEVRPTNANALAFYDKHGFLKIGVRRGYYPALGNTREDAFVMKKDIDLDHAPSA